MANRPVFFFFVCYTHIFSVTVQKLAYSASHGINKKLIPNKPTNKMTERKILSPRKKHNAHAPQVVSN